MLSVRPVTRETWGDFAALFEARGSPHFCWCMIYRDRRSHEMSKDEKREAIREMIAGGTPVGLLGYDGDTAVAWCSVAPRETLPKLARSKAMPSGGVAPAWAVTCFFVKRPYRRRGLTGDLLRAATAYAEANGAAVIEGYPWDTSANRSQFKGHSDAFRSAGFVQDGPRWYNPLEGRKRRATAAPRGRAGG